MQSLSTMRLAVLMALTSGIALLLQLNTARAVQRTYTLVQNNSTIAISGNIDGTAITSQGT
ncbi:MAG: hypothetical protein IT425_06720, partial [Pirellulales bacterium]|nr:hypothetical protein [Pirellulales bacterium]